MNHIFIGIGDIHGDTSKVAQIPGVQDAAGILISGDMTNVGDTSAVMQVVETVRAVNPRVYAQIGNMDKPETSGCLADEGINLHRQVHELSPGVGFMGIGYSATTPFNTPSEVSDETLGQWLDETYEQVKQYDRWVLVVHNPPFETGADKISSGAHVGSKAVREFILRTEPDVCFTGHIHESRCEEMLGKTKLVNPGMLGWGGYVVIEVTENSVDATVQTLA